jgi:hypothetical protein
MVQNGPAMKWVKSITRMPSRAGLAAVMVARSGLDQVL